MIRPDSEDETSRRKEAARTILASVATVPGLLLALPFVVLAAPLWLVRGVTRLGSALARSVQPPETRWGDLIRYEPEVGWMPRARLDVHARAGGLFHLTTDAEGWRGPMSLDDADVVVMGDSFAFGQGADDRNLFTEHVAGARVKSVGANGYNLVQSYLWMERLAPRLGGKTVVWFVYYDNDLLENLLPFQQHYRMPFVRERAAGQGWELVTEHVSPDPWPFPESRDYTTRLAEICSPSRLSRRVFDAADHLIRRARETLADAGAELTVVGVPSPELVRADGRELLASLVPDPDSFDATLPDRRLADICRRLDVPFLPLARHLTSRDYLPDDCHWTPRGHRRVGRLLADLVRNVEGSRRSRAPSPIDVPAEPSATTPAGS